METKVRALIVIGMSIVLNQISCFNLSAQLNLAGDSIGSKYAPVVVNSDGLGIYNVLLTDNNSTISFDIIVTNFIKPIQISDYKLLKRRQLRRQIFSQFERDFANQIWKYTREKRKS